MRKQQRKKLKQYVKNNRYRSVWHRAVRFMACIVVFCTTYALILPAITQEQTYFCGLEAHEHGPDCYTQSAASQLTCQIPEQHLHEPSCLDESGTPVCGIREGHIHSEDCYAQEILSQLSCDLTPHTHSDACRSDPNTDLETQADWEQTLSHLSLTGNWAEDLTSVAASQVGYRESERNYLAEEGQPHKGYTRYGAWYGIPYGKWDAMFVSFCLRYAGIPQEAIPWNSNSTLWLEALRCGELTADQLDKVPAAGDLLFYRQEEEIRTAIVLGMETVTEADGEYPSLRVIEGGREAQVLQHMIRLEDITILGCCGISQVQAKWDTFQSQAETEPTEPTEPAAPTEPPPQAQQLSQTAHTENYTVTVTYDASRILPEGAQLRVVEYPRDSEIFRQRCEEAGYELEWLLNIGFFLGEEELSLDGTFDVLVTSKLGEDLGQDITHFADSGAERITGEDASAEAGDGETAVSFSSDGFSDFGGGVARAAASYPLVTANPASLQTGVDYIIFAQGGSANQHILMGSDWNITPIQATTGYWSSPYTVGGSWDLTPAQVGNRDLSQFTWQIQRQDGRTYLVSKATGQRLTVSSGGLSISSGGTALGFRTNGAATEINGGDPWVRYENNDWRIGWYNGTNVYFAAVTTAQAEANYPASVITGEVHVDRLRFYNIVEGGGGVSALPGCVFEITGTTSGGQAYTATVVTDNSPQIALPADIPDGVYTIREVSVPDGYMRDFNHTREFWISGGKLVSEHNIGTFINHKLEQLTVNKTGEVEDYNNRIYQILLDARTNLRMYSMDPIQVLFLVDKSNSMLFPSGLEDTGKSITLRIDNPSDGNDNNNNLNNVGNNRSVLDSLDTSQVYYIIADPEGTSTVYAIWYDGSAWMYQDASYYAKAKQNNGPGYESDGETVCFPQNKSYSQQAADEDVNGINYRSNGGGLDYSSAGSSLGKYIDTMPGDSCSFRLYTAKDEYNRLHYLEEALANMIYELADANPANEVILIPFTKEVQGTIYPVGSSTPVSQPVKLTTSNAEMLADIITHIATAGGTRQDLALEHAYEQYLSNPAVHGKFDASHTYTILITDGAPVRSGDSAPQLGNANSGATTADNGEIYGRIKGWGAQVRKESTLMTVALGMGDVVGGRTVLENIASGDDFYCALDDASALTENMQRILFDSMKDTGQILIDTGLVEDEISDSFYPIGWTEPQNTAATGRTVLEQSNGKAWLLLRAGDWITLEGKFTTVGASDAAGQLLRRPDGTWYIRWQNQTLSGSGWKGTFYVKAKEDFIGGNAIDTNKQATVTVNDAVKTMDTPTVNVHLLDLNENGSEVTVYLGDLINGESSSPRDSVRAFWQEIVFAKIQEESGITDIEMMNRCDPDGDLRDGLERDAFYLKYALGYEAADGSWVPRDLTSDEWATLESGGSLTFPYVYDGDSSHGNVGYFTVRLSNTGGDYSQHTATHACQPGGQPLTENCVHPVETYTLTVTYTAYELGEEGRPNANVHNGTGSPGTEVRKAATGLNNGQGIVTSENIHEVHVISGKILVEKTFAPGTEWTAGDTFTFQLTRTGGETLTRTVTVDATGKATAVFDNLPRGTYTVTEAVDEEYAVKSVAVSASTNAYYTLPDPMQVSFTMGSNLAGENVIGKTGPADACTAYIDPVNGVYGEAAFVNAPRVYQGEIPVEKIWDNGPENHGEDYVYLVLYLDGSPVLDTQGNARLLRLDAASGWEGVFNVTLAHKDDKVENYNYSVREVRNISSDPLLSWQKAILENDGETVLYYNEALEEGGLLGIGGKGYVVQYSTAADGTHVVTNLKGYDMPETGGIGTHLYTFSGLALCGAALVYGYSLRRKRERGGKRLSLTCPWQIYCAGVYQPIDLERKIER